MLLINTTCVMCGHQQEDIVRGECPLENCEKCGGACSQDAFSYNPTAPHNSKMREVFMKGREIRNKLTGKTPWRKNSYSQSGND